MNQLIGPYACDNIISGPNDQSWTTGPFIKFLLILGRKNTKMKVFLCKSGKNYRKNVSSDILKSRKYIPTNTDLNVHIICFHFSKIFKNLE